MFFLNDCDKTVYSKLVLLLNINGFMIYSKLIFSQIIYSKIIGTMPFFNETLATFSTHANNFFSVNHFFYELFFI